MVPVSGGAAPFIRTRILRWGSSPVGKNGSALDAEKEGIAVQPLLQHAERLHHAIAHHQQFAVDRHIVEHSVRHASSMSGNAAETSSPVRE